MLQGEEKRQIIKEFGKHEQDTGSVEVQIAILTRRINQLNDHFRSFPKDKASRRGLLKMVGQRRSFLRYLKERNHKKYLEMLKRLNLRR